MKGRLGDLWEVPPGLPFCGPMAEIKVQMDVTSEGKVDTMAWSWGLDPRDSIQSVDSPFIAPGPHEDMTRDLCFDQPPYWCPNEKEKEQSMQGSLQSTGGENGRGEATWGKILGPGNPAAPNRKLPRDAASSPCPWLDAHSLITLVHSGLLQALLTFSDSSLPIYIYQDS